MHQNKKTVIHTVNFIDLDLNPRLLAGFQQHRHNTNLRRSHFFNGRYENIYLGREHLPALAELLNLANEQARKILHWSAIRSGSWFNAMPPGAITTRHNHDDSDELLSAVYYVHVPLNSGDLILYDAEPATRITPVAGQLIFFPPGIDHEVTRNNSIEERLSIAINFGPVDEN